MSFSSELKKKREELGLTLRQLEEKTGISDTALWRYEQGVGLLEMSVSHMAAISKFYGWELADMGKKIGRESAQKRAATDEAS